MTTVLRLDYETFSTVDISAGAWKYAASASTVVLCLAWAVNDEEPSIWFPGMKLSERLVRLIRDGVPVFAWNANFERAITEEVMELEHGFPQVAASQWNCSQAIAASVSLPLKLEHAAQVLKLAEQKDKKGAALLRFFAVPNKHGKRNLPADYPEKFKELCEYCLQDVRTERAVHQALPIQALPKSERRLWMHDSEINRRGVKVDIALCRGAVKITRTLATRSIKALIEVSNKRITTTNQGKRIIAFAKEHGVKLPNLQMATVEAALEDEDLPEPVRIVLTARALMSKAAAAKYVTAIVCAGFGDRVRGVHRFHKAHTGRWGGTLTQFQNLARPRKGTRVPEDLDLIRMGDADVLGWFHPDQMMALKDAVRNMVVAAKGKTLVVADLAAIECRVLAWMAGEEWLLRAFVDYDRDPKKNPDAYVLMAADIFGLPIEKVSKDDHRPLGKESELGCGYGMGAETFEKNCRKKGLKQPSALFERAVKAYRKKHPMVVKLWESLERCAITTITTGRKTAYRLIGFEMVGKYLTMILPSGRRLWYPEASVIKVKKWGKVRDQICFKTWFDKGNRWGTTSTYGGRLVENGDQAISRDVMADAIVAIEEEDNGHDVVMHIHDEVVAEAPADTKDAAVLISALARGSSWSKGLPLGAAGFVSPFYRKG